MNLGRILFFGLTIVAATAAYAKYDRTLDGKTKVWHNAPQSRVKATWSGERDEKGYATGKGTLTWFKVQRDWLTGSLLPTTKYFQVSQYKGKMIDGKLEGSVISTDSKGNTYHARFADGQKTGAWIAGSGRAASPDTEESSSPAQIAESPAEAPRPTPKLKQAVAETKPAEPPPTASEPVAAPRPATPRSESSTHSEDSLQALARPPSSLRLGAVSAPASPEPSGPTIETNAGESEPPHEVPAPAVDTSPANPDAQTVAALDTEFQSAVKTNDAAAMDRILSDDFVLVHGPGQTLSKLDLLQQARDKQGKYEHHEIEQGSQKVRVWRDTAVVTETLWVKGTENGKPIDQKVPVTATYVRTPNGWRYVSGQASVPAK